MRRSGAGNMRDFYNVWRVKWEGGGQEKGIVKPRESGAGAGKL